VDPMEIHFLMAAPYGLASTVHPSTEFSGFGTELK
jgi:hypothetical protein